MPVAQQVIVVVERQIAVLAETGATEDEIAPLRDLLEEAKASPDGTVPAESVEASPLHPDHKAELL